jgi:glucose-fructose oxidoreductase
MKTAATSPAVLSSSTRRQFVGQLAAGAAALALAPAVDAAGNRGAPPPPLPSKKMGVALVGLGGYSRGQLAPALQRTQHCALTGVATRDPEGKGKQWAQQYGFPEKNIYAYDKIAAMKDNPDIDIVYVVTPNSLHAQDVIAAAQAGKHVITEKPMGVTVAECDQMIKACRDAGVQLSLGYRNNFDPYFQEMMRIVRWRELGAVKGMSGEFSANFTSQGRIWRAIKQFAGGGPVMDLGVYVIHASILAAGGETPVAVMAKSTSGVRADIYQDVEETMEFTLEFANGAKSEGYTSYLGQKPGSAGSNRFRVDYERGFVNFPAAFNYTGTTASTQTGPLAFPDVATGNNYQQARQLDDFARCVRDKVPTSVPGEMGRQDMLVVEAIYASAANNGARTLVKA